MFGNRKIINETRMIIKNNAHLSYSLSYSLSLSLTHELLKKKNERISCSLSLTLSHPRIIKRGKKNCSNILLSLSLSLFLSPSLPITEICCMH